MNKPTLQQWRELYVELRENDKRMEYRHYMVIPSDWESGKDVWVVHSKKEALELYQELGQVLIYNGVLMAFKAEFKLSLLTWEDIEFLEDLEEGSKIAYASEDVKRLEKMGYITLLRWELKK